MQIRSTLSYWSTALLTVFLLSPSSGRLEGQMVNGKQVVRAELLTASDDFTKPFLIGLKFTMEPGWYLYWKNPGDAGLPVEVTWSLPDGYTAGELQFPTPSKFVYDDLIAYGYKNELVLFADIRPPGTPAASVPALRANLDWLVCKESCVRGRAEVVLAPATLQGTTLAANGRLLKKWRNLLPGPLSSVSLQISKPTVEGGGGKRKVSFTVRGDGAEYVTDFYPLGLDNAAIDHKSITVKQNTVSFEIAPYTEGETISTIKGLLITRGKAYECMVVLPVM
ncbi:MAG: protein-disulfide reductase DsbD domain-containing protein [Bacteroidota bacterium]